MVLKARVINKFRDKLNNLNVCHVGDIIEVSEDRFNSLRNSTLGKFVEKVEELEQNETEAEELKEDSEEEKVALYDLNKKELIDYSSEYNLDLDMKMTKEEMIEEIKKAESK